MNNISDILDKFRCPITQEIFYKAILAEDGHMYEKDIFNEWYKYSGTSPLTGLKIGNKITIMYDVNNIIDDLIECSDLKSERYCPNISYASNINRIDDIINYKKFEELLEYKKYDIKNMELNGTLQYFLSNCKEDKIIEHILDNSINIEYVDNIGNNIVTHACTSDNGYALKYLKQHGFNMQRKSPNDSSNTLHQICLHGSYKNIMFIINEYTEFDSLTNSGSVFYYIRNNNIISEKHRLLIKNKIFECIKKQGIREFIDNKISKKDKDFDDLKTMFKELS